MASRSRVRDRRPGSHGRSADRPLPVSKRSLVAVSHAIESALLDGPGTDPTVVVAMFQRLTYFEREYAVYDRLARAGATVVIGFADGEAHHVPPGCHMVLLDPEEPLADEWTVIGVDATGGAYLVATDAHRFDPTENSLEAGREFVGRWGYARVQAANELARMRAALGARLDGEVGALIDGLLRQVMPAGGAAAASVGTDGEAWATLSLHHMVARMQDAREGSRRLRAQLSDAHGAVAARSAAHLDPQSGLVTPEFLARWSGTGRPTALPVGVAVFDVAALDRTGFGRADPGTGHHVADILDDRTAHHAARHVAAALTQPLGPVDAAVRLSDREFAIVVPAASFRHLHRLVAVIAEQLELSSHGYPHVPLTATVASTVTLARPLPLDDLHLALGCLDRPGVTLADDPITIVTTAASAGDASTAGGELDGPAGTTTADVTDAFPRVRVSDRPTTGPAGLSPAAQQRADRASSTLATLQRRHQHDQSTPATLDPEPLTSPDGQRQERPGPAS